MEGLLAPTLPEKMLGRAEVRQTFTVAGPGRHRGLLRHRGQDAARQAQARLVRDHVVVHDGRMTSLRRFKDDVREVASGYECGIGLENFQDVKVGDIIEAYEVEEVARRLAPSGAKSGQSASRPARRAPGLSEPRRPPGMVVGVLRLELLLPENHSLKGKRSVLRAIKARVQNKFNVSIAECEDHDLWQRATLGVSQVGAEQRTRGCMSPPGGAIHR